MTTDLQETELTELTEAETLAAREERRTKAEAAVERLREFQCAGEYVTSKELGEILLHMLEAEHWNWMSFVIAHVKKRAVLRDDVPDGLRAIAAQWAGVYAVAQAYDKGSLVVHHNALWIAKMATAAKPGAPEGGWALVVKSPR